MRACFHISKETENLKKMMTVTLGLKLPRCKVLILTLGMEVPQIALVLIIRAHKKMMRGIRESSRVREVSCGKILLLVWSRNRNNCPRQKEVLIDVEPFVR